MPYGIVFYCFLTFLGPRCGPVYVAPVPQWQPTYQIEYQWMLQQERWISPAPAPAPTPPPPTPITNPCGWVYANGGWTPHGQCGDTIYFPPCQVLSPGVSVCA